jgi:drug/metabolite transporter (DMT)-like permease
MFDVHYWMALGAAILTAAGQLLLKRGARHAAGRHVLRLWLNAFTLAGYLVLAGVTLMNLYAFKVVPLRVSLIFSPLSLCLVIVFSVGLFGERLSGVQKIAGLFVIAGIAVFNL